MKNKKDFIGKIKNCRVCGGKFYKKPLLKYSNMPAVAQHLPDNASLQKERGVDLEVVECLSCGLVQISSSPVPYYREVIRAAGFSPEMKEFRLKQFADFVRKYSLKDKKAIEIGCGRGEYLSLIKQSGAKAYGLEYGTNSVKDCRKKELNVFRGFIDKENYQIKCAPFDAFFMFSFLEHLPDPGTILRGISNNLADNAVGIIEVPNFDMMQKKKLFSEFMRDHLLYFGKDTFIATLNANGFEVVNCQGIWHDYIIYAIVRKRKKIDPSFFSFQERRIKKEIKDFLSRFQGKKIAVWGAGHQAFAVLSIFKLGKKIKYVIDSADFKQGKYTPATHIPIVSPDMLKKDPVDAVIIMAGSYSDEIARTIREKYNKEIKVSILRDFGLETA